MGKKIWVWILLGILFVLTAWGCGTDEAVFLESESGARETDMPDSQGEEASTEEPASIYVYVCGAVLAPGVYEMKEGDRVCDLFRVAGGLTEDGAKDYWNQARELVDGEMIYVPTEEEAKERSPEEWSLAGGTGTMEHGLSTGKVNINTASMEELMTLPGIGESKAMAIIAYRQECGGFSAIEQLMEIAGIKDGVFSKIEEYIEVN